MKHHKWKNDVCVNCGITRIKKRYEKVVRTYSRLDKHGVWIDVPVWQFGSAWFYGQPHPEHANTVKAIGFERPDCKKLNP